MEFHEYANIFPMMTPEEHAGIVADMQANGFNGERWPIVTYQGKILDGRNRWRASQSAGVKPVFVEFKGDDEAALKFVKQSNERRNLKPDQRVLMGARLAEVLEKLARERQAEAGVLGALGAEHGSEGGRGNKKTPLVQDRTKGVSEKKKQDNSKRSTAQAGKVFGVGHTSMSKGKKVAKTAPDVEKAVMQDGVSFGTVEAMAKVASLPQQQRTTVIEKVKAGESPKQAIKNALSEVKKEVQESAAKADSAAPSQREIKVVSGQWWRLGKHTLYCGDTSKPDFISKSPIAALGFADPPYGAGVGTFDDSKFYWCHDWLIDKCGIVAVTPGIVSIFEFARKTNMPYLWSHSTWIKNGMTRGALGFGNWIYTAIFSRSSIHRNAQDFESITIDTGTTDETTHKGRKPSKYMGAIISLFTKEGETIIDPFLGSGQTLLVSENLNRVCFGGEIMPEHCELIIKRWESLTGKNAEVINDAV